MIKGIKKVSCAKEIIEKLKEKEVEVTLNLGRNKYVSFSARLTGVYPALFTVKPIDSECKVKTSYSYSEYLCGKVKLTAK